MLPYIYFYIFIALIYILSIITPKMNNGYFIISSLIVWLFIALRAESVGADTTAYCDFYRNSYLLYLGAKTDLGFELIGRFLRLLGVGIEQFIFFISTIYLYGLYYIVNKTSRDKILSLVLFTIVGTSSIFIFLYMSMIRQCCSISIFFIAIYLLFTYRKKYLPWTVLLYIFAVSIHGSMLFTLPFIVWFYLYDIPKKKYIYVAIVATYLFAAFDIISVSKILEFIFGSFGELTSRDYSGYADVNFGQIEQKGLFNMNLLPFSTIGLGLTYFSSIKNLNVWYVKLFLISAVLNNIFYDNLMWSRLILPFTLLSIVAIPNLLKEIGKYQRWGILSFIFIYFVYKTYTQLLFQASPVATGNICVPYEWIF